jgi:hypothetical protein
MDGDRNLLAAAMGATAGITVILLLLLGLLAPADHDVADACVPDTASNSTTSVSSSSTTAAGGSSTATQPCETTTSTSSTTATNSGPDHDPDPGARSPGR